MNKKIVGRCNLELWTDGWVELRKVNGKLMKTFQKSAYAKGLLTNRPINEYTESVIEAVRFKNDQDLRALFDNLISGTFFDNFIKE